MNKKPQSDQKTFNNRTLRSRKNPSEPDSLKRRNSSSLPDYANKKQRLQSVDSLATQEKEQEGVAKPPESPQLTLTPRSNRRHSQLVATLPSELPSLRTTENQQERGEKPIDAKPYDDNRESVDVPDNHLQSNKGGQPQSELEPTGASYRKPLELISEPERPQSDDNRKRESKDWTAPHQTGNTVSTQALGRSEIDSQFLLYIRNLSTEIVHHEIFEYFSLFGNLKRVCVLQRTETYKFAMILFTTKKSLKRALGANPHNLRGRQYFCHEAGSWHLGCFRTDWKLSDAYNRSIFRDRFQIKVPLGVNVHLYIYQTSASLTKAQPNPEQSAPNKSKRLALLPQLSMTLLNYLRSEQSPSQPHVDETQPDLYSQTLFAAMGKNYNFVRHSYTNFSAHKKLPGQYETVPIASQIGLTSIAYADLRDKPDLITFFYQTA